MTGNAWIGELIAAIFYLWVGIRLGRLASRTREPPERLLSGMFFSSSISYLFYTIPLAIPIETLWLPFNFAGRIAYIPAPILIAVFTREVFRSESRWSAFFVYTTATLLAVGVAGSAMIGDWEGFSLENPFFWFEWLGYTLPFSWAGLEALIQYCRALRRRRLGLCDRMVCNRLLLWGAFGIVQLVISFVLLRMYADFEANNAFSGFFDGLTGALEILSIALVWLVFFPPRFYRQRIASSDAGDAPAEEV